MRWIRPSRPSRWQSLIGGCAVLLLATLWVYAPTGEHPFVSYDDPGYVTQNELVKRGLTLEGAVAALRTRVMGNWQPVTLWSHMLDVELFGLDAGKHHLVSVLLHGLAAAVLWLWLSLATGAPWRAAGVAALFAIHPLRVESVAWVAERKDVLSGLLFQLTILSWLRYVRSPGALGFLGTALLLAAGLMAKPMLVTVPVVLLVLDVWPLSRVAALAGTAGRRSPAALLREKLPLFVLSALSAATTLWAQRADGAMSDLEAVPLALRLANAVTATTAYLRKLAWPTDLAVLYPWEPDLELTAVAASAAVLLAITGVAVLTRGTRPYLAAGWAWFLVMLLPVIGIVQVGAQSMADRYTYLPSIGVLVMLVWGAADLAQGSTRTRRGLAVAGLLTLCVLGWQTRVQLGHWRSSLALYERALAVTRRNHLIMENYGLALAEAHRVPEAIRALHGSIALSPGRAEPYFTLGTVLVPAAGDAFGASRMYERAIQLRPDHVAAHQNLGGVRLVLGDAAGALSAFEEARRLGGPRPILTFNMGLAHVARGDLEAAAREAARLGVEDAALAARLAGLIREKERAGR